MSGIQRDTPIQKTGDPKDKSAIFFILLGVVVAGLCLPLLYYSSLINWIVGQHGVKGAV
jgi:hypothetical protein